MERTSSSRLLKNKYLGQYKSAKGRGRNRVILTAYRLGGDWAVSIYNENAHIGAVAVGEYDSASQRVSTSVITRLGHKDDAVAQKCAYLVSKVTKRPVCVIAGIHVENISQAEITEILENCDRLVAEFTGRWQRCNL